MTNITKKVAAFIVALLLLSGCDFAFLAGGKTIGINSGRFIYTDGFSAKTYRHPFDQVWHACEGALVDMKASGVEKNKKIATGSIKTVVNGDKVTIEVTYVSAEQTSVAVLIGKTGNNAASELIHEKIASNLQNP